MTAVEEDEVAKAEMKSDLLQPSHPPFLEVVCRSTGKIRRFAAGTDARFAVWLINQNNNAGSPLALRIEAVKEGEEPVNFGPNAVLVNYGQGWQLQTVSEQGQDEANNMQQRLNQYPSIQKPRDLHSTGERKPESGSNISFVYLGKILVAFAFILFLGATFTLFLEYLPDLISFVTSPVE